MYYIWIKIFCFYLVLVLEGGYFLFIFNNRIKSVVYNVICEINMVCLCFLGCFGCRFDCLGVCYGVDEVRNVNDFLILFVVNIYCGLCVFREFVGDLDEVIFNFFIVFF